VNSLFSDGKFPGSQADSLLYSLIVACVGMVEYRLCFTHIILSSSAPGLHQFISLFDPTDPKFTISSPEKVASIASLAIVDRTGR
jgi:hypothetical protein